MFGTFFLHGNLLRHAVMLVLALLMLTHPPTGGHPRGAAPCGGDLWICATLLPGGFTSTAGFGMGTVGFGPDLPGALGTDGSIDPGVVNYHLLLR